MKVTISGTKKDGYILSVFGEDGFSGDMPLTYEEIILLKKKLEKFK